VKISFPISQTPTKRLLILGMDRSGSIDKYLLNIKENCKKLFEKSTQMVLQWVGGPSLFSSRAIELYRRKKSPKFCSFFLSGYFLSLDCCLKLLTHIGIDVNGARYAKAERERSMCENTLTSCRSPKLPKKILDVGLPFTVFQTY
jgi:hypothetical protein